MPASGLFFLQIFVVLTACWCVGALAKHFGQPRVVGEMIAGVLLGPSFLGWLAPSIESMLFPRESLTVVFTVGQLGVGLYMLLVGLDFPISMLRNRLRMAVAVSAAGMLVPFVLGAGLALWLVRVDGLFSSAVTQPEASLFMGAALAITAFPMLARIVRERGLSGTLLGSLALSAGAVDDVTAWCLLAVVVASFQGDTRGVAKALLGVALYVVVVLTLVRKVFARLERSLQHTAELPAPLLGFALATFAACAWLMDFIGVHAVFGGFLLGAALPRGRFARELQRKLEPATVVLLLPMFFTYSGLNTRLDLFDGRLMLVAGAALAAACAGKALACWSAARLMGADQRTALALGTLMNARGLMELIVVNVGLQLGIIQPALFSVMVTVAVLTTLAVGPILDRIHREWTSVPLGVEIAGSRG